MKKTILLLLTLLLFKTNFSQNGLCFTTAPYSPVISNPLVSSWDKNDINNDGQIDFICSFYAYNSFNLILSNGVGAYSPSIYINVPGAVEFLKLGDFNLDGKQDIAASVKDSNLVYILLGTGLGSFNLPSRHSVGSGPKTFVVKDLNNDSKLDIAIVNSLSNNISVLLGNGAGTFSPAVNYTTVTTPHGIKAADFNNDGKIDIIVTNGTTSTILKGNGNGTFVFASTLNFGVTNFFITYGYAYEAVDLNNDSKADIVGINPNQNSISVIKGNGNFTFLPAVDYSVGSTPSSINFGDFNSDGKPDLVSSNMYSHDISILPNNGSGIFAPAVNYTVAPASSFENPWLIAVDDMNGDNKADIIVAKDNSSQLNVLLNCNNVDVGLADNMKLNSDYKLYPNPAIDHIELIFFEDYETNNNKIEITNSFGQLIKQEEIVLNDQVATISLNDLPNGVYYLNLKGANKRFVIAR